MQMTLTNAKNMVRSTFVLEWNLRLILNRKPITEQPSRKHAQIQPRTQTGYVDCTTHQK